MNKVSDAASAAPNPIAEAIIIPTIAVVLPSEASSAFFTPNLTDVEMDMNTLGPGVTVKTKTATTYKSQVEKVIF